MIDPITRFRLPRPDHVGRYVPGDHQPRPVSAAYAAACRLRSSADWQRLRSVRLAQYPVCEWCDDAPAVEVHHIRRVSDDIIAALDADNLMSVCQRCHDLLDGAIRRGIDIGAIRDGRKSQ